MPFPVLCMLVPRWHRRLAAGTRQGIIAFGPKRAVSATSLRDGPVTRAVLTFEDTERHLSGFKMLAMGVSVHFTNPSS